jgi:hypothetical protein
LDALAITSLPASTAVEEFSNRFEEDVASERDLRTQEKTASGKVATLKRQLASFTTGNALGSPEQIAHARQLRESLWMPLRSTLLRPSQGLPAEELPEGVIRYEKSTAETDRLADSAVRDAEQVAELAALSSQLEEGEATLAGIRGNFEKLRLSIEKRNKEWQELWHGVDITPTSPREMSHWLANVQALFKDRTELRTKRLELEGLATSITQARRHWMRLRDLSGLPI